MPAYNAAILPTALYQGDIVNVWNAEAVSAGNQSQRVALGITPSTSGQDIAVELSYAGAPGTFSCDIMGAETDVLANYVVLANVTQTALNAGNVAQLQALRFVEKFILLRMNSLTNAVNVTAKITKG